MAPSSTADSAPAPLAEWFFVSGQFSRGSMLEARPVSSYIRCR